MAKITTNSTPEAINEKDVSAKYSIGIQTLRNWRHMGRGPAYIKLDRAVRYSLTDLEKYFQSHRVDPEANR
jgi:hypothetical protein